MWRTAPIVNIALVTLIISGLFVGGCIPEQPSSSPAQEATLEPATQLPTIASVLSQRTQDQLDHLLQIAEVIAEDGDWFAHDQDSKALSLMIDSISFLIDVKVKYPAVGEAVSETTKSLLSELNEDINIRPVGAPLLTNNLYPSLEQMVWDLKRRTDGNVAEVEAILSNLSPQELNKWEIDFAKRSDANEVLLQTLAWQAETLNWARSQMQAEQELWPLEVGERVATALILWAVLGPLGPLATLIGEGALAIQQVAQDVQELNESVQMFGLASSLLVDSAFNISQQIYQNAVDGLSEVSNGQPLYLPQGEVKSVSHGVLVEEQLAQFPGAGNIIFSLGTKNLGYLDVWLYNSGTRGKVTEFFGIGLYGLSGIADAHTSIQNFEKLQISGGQEGHLYIYFPWLEAESAITYHILARVESELPDGEVRTGIYHIHSETLIFSPGEKTTPIPETPQIEIRPNIGTVGASFTISGSHFTPNRAVTLYFIGVDGEEFMTTQKLAGTDGWFSFSLVAYQDYPIGTNTVWAVDDTTGKKSNEVSFTIVSTLSAAMPTSPGLSSSPGPTISNLTPTFQWSGVSGADGYGFYISEYPYGSTNLVYENENISGSSTSFNLPSGVLENGKKYRWNIRAHNSAGWSDFSSKLYFQTTIGEVTLTLYVHEDSASGPIISGATVTGQDGEGNAFSQVTNSSGYVTIIGAPGTWSFSAGKSGYETNSWSQSITADGTKHAYLIKEEASSYSPTLVDVGIASSPWLPQTFLQAESGDTIYTLYTFSYSGPNMLVNLKTAILDTNGNEIGNQVSGPGLWIINPFENPITGVGIEYKLPDDAEPGIYDVKFSIWNEDFTEDYDSIIKQGWLQIASGDVILTLYVHENSASGPITSGATVTGQDGGGNSFSQVTNSNGYVTITGAPGTWSFTAGKSGYETNSWSQSITADGTKHAYLIRQVVYPQVTGVSPPQPSAQPTRQWLTILGNGFVSDSQVTLRIGGSTYVIPSDRTQFVSSGQINVYVGLTDAGTWSAQVTNPGGYQSNIFSFQVVYPQVTGVNPSQPTAQPTRQWLTIIGNGFVSESQVTLRIGGSTYVIPADRTQFVSSNQIKVYVGLTDAGTWTAQVTNLGGYQSNIFSFQVVP